MITPVTAFPLSLKAGQKGTINLKLTSGASYSSVLAAIFVNGTSQKLTCSPSGVITLPAMPVGLHLLEVRVGSVSAIYQHVEVLPTPISQSDPASVLFDISQEPSALGSWTIEGGRQGPAGAAGKDGVTFTPHINGNELSWTNDGNLPNPDSVTLGGSGGGGGGGGGYTVSDENLEAMLELLFSPDKQTTAKTANTASQSLLFSELRSEGKFFTPPMLLHAVTLWAQSSPAQNPLHLTLWEESTDGSATWRYKACSQAATVQGDQGTTFTFDPPLVITGKGIRFGCVAEPTSDWPEDNSIFVPVNLGVTDTAMDDESWSQGEDGGQYYFVPTHQLTYSALQIAAGSGSSGKDGKDGKDGVTFTPHMSSDGTLTWTNDGNLPNPDPVSLMGPQGPPGKDGTSSSGGGTSGGGTGSSGGTGSGGGSTSSGGQLTYEWQSWDEDYWEANWEELMSPHNGWIWFRDTEPYRRMKILYFELSRAWTNGMERNFFSPAAIQAMSFEAATVPSQKELYLVAWDNREGEERWRYRCCSKLVKFEPLKYVGNMTFEFDPPLLVYDKSATRYGIVTKPTSEWPSDNSIFVPVELNVFDTPLGDESWAQGADGTQYYLVPRGVTTGRNYYMAPIIPGT